MFRVVAVPVVGCREPLGLWGWARGRVVRGAGRLPPRRARPFRSESAAIARRAGVVNGVAPLGGLAVGALGCGVLVQFAPVPTHLVYALLLGGMVVAAVLVFFLPETSARRPGGLASLAPRLGIPARLRPDVLALLPILVASWALGGLYLSLGPSVAAGLFGLGNHLIGGLVVTLLCGIGAATAFALRAWPTGRVLRIAAALLTAGTALTLVGVEFGAVALAVAGTAIAGSASVPSAQCFGTLARLAAPEERGELFAVAYVIAYLAFSVPAVLAGLASTVFGLHTTAVVYGLIVVVLGLVAPVAQQIRSSGRARWASRGVPWPRPHQLDLGCR